MSIADKMLNRRTFIASLALALGACTNAPESNDGEDAPTKSGTSDTTDKQDEPEPEPEEPETTIDQEPNPAEAEDTSDALPVAWKTTIDEYEESYIICFYEPEEHMEAVPLDGDGEEIEYRPYQVFSGYITNTFHEPLTVSAEIDPRVSYTDEYGERETADYFVDISYDLSTGKKRLTSVKPGDTREFTYTMPAFDPELEVSDNWSYTKKIYKDLAYEGIESVDLSTFVGDRAAMEWYAYPDEYEIGDERIEFDGDGGCEVTGTITNNTNYYWESATIYYSFYWDESLETEAYGKGGTVGVERLAPGASADFEISYKPYTVASDDRLHFGTANACVFDRVKIVLDKSKDERPDWLAD